MDHLNLSSQMYPPNHLLPGVTATGHAPTPAMNPLFPPGLIAGMALKGTLGSMLGSSSSSSSSSFSSASKDVSIIKYDEYFKKDDGPNWCLDNLKKKNGDPALTADEIKANPPLGLKFKGCDLIIPIPNPKAMSNTNDVLLRQVLGPNFAASGDDIKKDNTTKLSKALLIQYVEECGYGTAAHTDPFCAKPNMVERLPNFTRGDKLLFDRTRKTNLASNSYTDKRPLRHILNEIQ